MYDLVLLGGIGYALWGRMQWWEVVLVCLVIGRLMAGLSALATAHDTQTRWLAHKLGEFSAPEEF